MKKSRTNIIKLSTLSLLGAILSIILSELTLQLLRIPNHALNVWQPNLKKLFLPNPDVFPGIKGSSWLRINSIGFRGKEMPENATNYILVLGGSAAECLYLDQDETWPAILESKMNDLKLSTWIGNAAQSGRNLRHNLHQIKYLPQYYKKINTIILLIGVNDLLIRLNQGDNFTSLEYGTELFNQETFGFAFKNYPDQLRYEMYNPGNAFYKKSALWHLLRKFKDRWMIDDEVDNALVLQDERGEGLVKARTKRKLAGSFIESLPDLKIALAEYENNIKTAIKLSRANSIKLILLTQPAIWRVDDNSSNSELLWMGHGTDNKYYSESALAMGLEIFNDKLREIAGENDTLLIDLARGIPRTTAAFYDDMHFNENGARLVADNIAKAFQLVKLGN